MMMQTPRGTLLLCVQLRTVGRWREREKWGGGLGLRFCYENCTIKRAKPPEKYK